MQGGFARRLELVVCAMTLGAALPAAASVTPGQLCTISGAGSFGPCSAATCTVGAGVSVNCTGGGDPGDVGGDDELVFSGSCIQVVGDLVQSGSPGLGITNLGCLEVDALARTGGPGPITLTLGPDGIACDPGSTCSFEGGYRRANPSDPTVDPDRAAANYVTLAEVIPCGTPGAAGFEPNCNAAGSADHVVLAWDGACAAQASDVMCFVDPDRSTPDAPVDDGYCYTIESVDEAGGQCRVTVNVDQGERNQVGYPLARRRLVQSTLTAPAAAGARRLCLDATAPSAAALDADGSLTGRWVRMSALGGPDDVCSDGDALACAGEPLGYKIMRTDASSPTCPAGSHELWLADLAGLREARATGTPLWIDYGWAPGDPVYFMVPVTLRSATAATADSTPLFRGTVTVQGLVVADADGFEVLGATLERFKDVWVRDDTNPASNFGDSPLRLVDTSDFLVDHLTITGGGDQENCGGPCDRHHSVRFDGTVSGATVRDLAVRHTGDDTMVCQIGIESLDLTVERVRSQFVSGSANSASLIDMTVCDTNGQITVTDASCDDCLSHDGAPLLLFLDSASRVMAIGLRDASFRTGGGTVEDFVGIGAHVPTTFLAVLPEKARRCVVRDVEAPAPSTTLLTNTLVSGWDLRDCFVHDVTFNSGAGGLHNGAPGIHRIENSAFVNVGREGCSTCRVFQANDATAAAQLVIERTTFSTTSDWTSLLDRILAISNLGAGGLTLDGLLVAHHVSATDRQAFLMTAADVAATNWGGHGPCFHDIPDGLFTDPAAEAALPLSAVVGPAPGFVDRDAYRFDPLPGSVAETNQCGIRGGSQSPGVHQRSWMHALARLEPEFVPEPAGAGAVALAVLGALAARRARSAQGLRKNSDRGRSGPQRAAGTRQ
jgi:hypothetical protein